MIPRAQILPALQASATITGLAADRLFSVNAPQGTAAPLVVWSLVASTAENTHGEPTDFGRHLFQFDCQAKTLAEAAALAEAVGVAMEAGPVSCTIEGEREGYSKDTELYVVSVDIAFQS